MAIVLLYNVSSKRYDNSGLVSKKWNAIQRTEEQPRCLKRLLFSLIYLIAKIITCTKIRKKKTERGGGKDNISQFQIENAMDDERRPMTDEESKNKDTDEASGFQKLSHYLHS